ncbi:MAG: C-terminal binding protein [Ethanoligenens sp.]
MGKPSVLYYNIDDTLDYERSLLAQWGIADDVELVEVKDQDNKKPFVEYAADADGMVVEYQKITRGILEQLPKLKIVSLQSIGYNNVDIPAATEHGVYVTNAPGFCTEEVALHTVGLIIDLVRKLSFFDRSVRAGHWNPLLGPTLHRLTGQKIGLVFFGSIPKRMTPILKAMGLQVLVYAPTKTSEYLAEFGVDKVQTLDELLEQSDIVSLHTPLLPETTHLISAAHLKRMKKSAFLINTARGAVVDEEALVQALKNGEIAGAGIDVIEDEVNETSGLFGMENVVITPHAAFVSEQSFYSAREIALDQLVSLLVHKKRPSNLVNKDVRGDY